MNNRAKELIAALQHICTRIELLKADVARHSANVEKAQNRQMFEPRLLAAIESTALAVANEIERFNVLVREYQDVPGIRDGQINGVGTLLMTFEDVCAQLIAELRGPRISVAA